MRDVQRASQKVHVLENTRYEIPENERKVVCDDADEGDNAVDGMDDGEGWEEAVREREKEMQKEHVNVLRRFGRAREESGA